MTPQEAQMLDDLVRKVEGTQLTEKDPDAEALLKDGLARDPDAIYKLAQTVLIQNLALEQAHAQMQQLQQQLAPPQPPPARATSFLGGLLHRNPAPAHPAPAQPGYEAVPPQYAAPQPGYGTPGYATGGWGQPSYPPAGSGYGAPAGGGFLRSAATTAAGVAGGMLAFEGMEHLLHGGFGGGYGGFGGPAGMPVEETVVNNYYEQSPGQPAGGFEGEPMHEHESQTLQPAADYGTSQGDVLDTGQDVYDTSSDTVGSDDLQQGGFDDGGTDQIADDHGFGDDLGGGDLGGGDGTDYV